MARILSGHLQVDVQFANYSKGVIAYRVQFLYKRSPLFNPKISHQNTFIFKSKENSLISAINKSLQRSIALVWEPTESELFLEIIPVLSLRGGAAPEDVFQLVFNIELTEPSVLGNDEIPHPISLNVLTKRYQLESFVIKLQKEYEVFCEKHKLDYPFKSFKKALRLTSKKKTSTLEKRFHLAMMGIYNESRRRGHKVDSLIAFIEEHGGRGAAKLMLRGPDMPRWVKKLIESGNIEDLDLSVEALVLKPKWTRLFTKKERGIAQQRLNQWRNP
ncbi:MAG: hypothetical protein HGA87_00530 [Desulfobulbaceae bacterium]|nr:hypothetical protein [Desulfobulbaceae bacterium]